MLKLPQGFQVLSFAAGIKYEKRNDMGLILSEEPCSYAGLFTSNKVYAAPVRLCRERLGEKIQAVLVNSGNANACTGEKGYEDALLLTETIEKKYQLKAKALSLSTGVIGVPLPVIKMIAAIETMPELKNTPEDFARTIMTTDSFPKAISKTIEIEGREVTICGFAKGAGMISPNMATMLCFLLTDAEIKTNVLQKILKQNTEETFNSITVDGDMSTNDSIILLANGKSGVKIKKNKSLFLFQNTLLEIMEYLAKSIVKDGEGATKLIEIQVKKAKNKKDAEKIGRAVANSLLVKTAFFGNDANWGRILAAVGYSKAKKIEEEKIDLFYLDRFLFLQGKPLPFDKKEMVEKLKNSKEVVIKIIMNQGKASKRFFTCDLSYDYVKINAEYTT